MSQSDYKVMSIPVIKLANPLDSLDVNDMNTLDDTAIVLETLIGACLAHQDCGPGCGMYRKDMVDKLMLMHHAIDELAEAIAKNTGAYREDADEARATARSEMIYRKVSKIQGKTDAEIDEELIELRLSDEIDSASERLHEGGGLMVGIKREDDGSISRKVEDVDRDGRRNVSDVIKDIMSGKPQKFERPAPEPRYRKLAEKPMDKKFNA